MKKRNMFYSNYNAGGFIDPYFNNMGQNIPPQFMQNNINNQDNALYDFEMRLEKLERQINNIDSRLSKLELSTTKDMEKLTNNYMI